MRVFIKTFGCKVNSFESSAMAELLRARGCEAAASEAESDAVIVNSCTVTDRGDQKTRQYLRRVKRENPDCLLVLAGCFPQAFPEKAANIPEADLVCGTGSREQTLEALFRCLEDRRRRVEILPNRDLAYEPLSAAEPDGHTRAFLKIEDGCERFCSYCIVPFARGPVRCLPLEDLKTQAAQTAARGFSEIVLTGINLSCYGQGQGFDLVDAVAAASLPEGIKRVRLGSLEPDMLGEEMLDRLALETKLCAHFHLSLQSGCDATLKRMNRRYTAAEYLKTAGLIRERFERAVFTTDIIAGFPGESESEFSESLAFAESFGFLKIHVFPYSPREGTAAARMPGQIEKSVKEARAALLSEAGERSRERVLRSFVGSRARVILERQRPDGSFGGYTDRYLPARVRGEGLRERDVVEGEIRALENGECVVEPRA
ncbi:MAG: tRNA (N(6)-L-threonylcarbamoyladenosine(37)-C(2))-methylthiotransferase MtaB [Oscillospiraceae bacterium]|nr:tRNA (N(6)-L-threonylcarbamoyladenosine(37)-C(2))-methylthiotransferase MtaB [Oscillospiraceae bacterium]